VKFRYISRGMITAFLIPIFLLSVLAIFVVLLGAHYLMDPIYSIWLFVIGVFLIIVRNHLEKNHRGEQNEQ